MNTLSQAAKAEKGGKEHQGEFVLKGQEISKDFSHVSKLWLDKTLTFEEMLRRGREFQARCKDVGGTNLSGLVSRRATLRCVDIGDLVLTEQSQRQLCAFLGLPSSYLDFLSTADEGLYDYNFNAAVDRAAKNLESYERLRSLSEESASVTKPEKPAHVDREVFLRLLTSKDGPSVVRAVLSNRYAVINNLPVIETLADVVPGGRVSHLYYDGDTLRANILVPEALRTEDDSDYGGGISVLNNETGRTMFRSRPFVFRAICMNGNIWDKTEGVEFNRRHLGTIDWKEFRKQIVLNVQRQIPLAQKHIEKVLSLKGVPVTQQEIERTIVYLGRRERLTLDQTRAWGKGWHTEFVEAKNSQKDNLRSAFGVVQGLTRAAQTFKFDAQEFMETLSARLVDGNWDRVFSAATSEVTADEAREVLTAA